MSDANFLEFIGPLLFKAADKLFKFISWMFILAGLWYVYEITKSNSVWWVYCVSKFVFGSALFAQALYLCIRDPSTLNVPEQFHTPSRLIQIVVGMFFGILITSPYLFMDEIMNAIQHARLK